MRQGGLAPDLFLKKQQQLFMSSKKVVSFNTF